MKQKISEVIPEITVLQGGEDANPGIGRYRGFFIKNKN
jgi:hypothetical protein